MPFAGRFLWNRQKLLEFNRDWIWLGYCILVPAMRQKSKITCALSLALLCGGLAYGQDNSQAPADPPPKRILGIVPNYRTTPTLSEYTPMGTKLGLFKGSTIQQLYIPLPGGAKAEYLSWGLSHYRHADWLGSDRLESSASNHSILDNNAYAPFGEPYAQTGNGEISFTSQNKDTENPNNTTAPASTAAKTSECVNPRCPQKSPYRMPK